MNDRPIYYVRMNDVSVRTGVHILSGTDAGIGLYELCFMFLHFLFAHTLNTQGYKLQSKEASSHHPTTNNTLTFVHFVSDISMNLLFLRSAVSFFSFCNSSHHPPGKHQPRHHDVVMSINPKHFVQSLGTTEY